MSIAKVMSPSLPRGVAVGGEALRDRPGELARLLPRPRRGARRVIGVAADRPRPAAPHRLAVEVGVAGVGGVAGHRPEPPDRLPVDREGQRVAGPDRGHRLARALVGGAVDAEVLDPEGGEHPLEARVVGALGKPEAAGLAEAAAVGGEAGVELEQPALAGRDQRQDRVGGRGAEQLDPA